MRKLTIWVLTAIIMTAATVNNLTVFAGSPIRVVMDGKEIPLDVPPLMVNDRVLVPLRGIFEAAGAAVLWDGDTKTVTAQGQNSVVKITIDSTSAIVNNETRTLDTPAKIIDGKTYVPLRFVLEGMGAEVGWDGPSQTVTINTGKSQTPSGQQQAGKTSEDLFAPVIDAYRTLEKSGYTQFDKSIIGDSLLTSQKDGTYNFGWETLPSLVYCFYDINSDGLPELLIGANTEYEYIISGIYALQNNAPTSIIQAEERHFITLLSDKDGNGVIEYSRGHMGSAEESFYSVDKAGKLVKLDTLYTGEVEEGGSIKVIRYKDVNGDEVVITEEEYTELLQKYGALGYESLVDMDEARIISIDWKSIS